MGFLKGTSSGFTQNFKKKKKKKGTSQQNEGKKKDPGEKQQQQQQEMSYQHNVRTHIPVPSEMQQDERKPGRKEDPARGTVSEANPHEQLNPR